MWRDKTNAAMPDVSAFSSLHKKHGSTLPRTLGWLLVGSLFLICGVMVQARRPRPASPKEKKEKGAVKDERDVRREAPVVPERGPETKPHVAPLTSEQRAAKQRVQLQKLRQREVQILEQMDKLDQERMELVVALQKMRQKVRALAKEVAAARQAFELQEQICQAQAKNIRPRLRWYYRLARMGSVRVLMGAKTLKKLAFRWKSMAYITRKDAELLLLYQKMRNKAKRKSELWKNKQAVLLQRRAAMRKKEREMLTNRRQKEKALTQIFREKEMFRRALREMRKSRRQIQQMLIRWNQAGVSSGLKRLRGQLPWPIPGYSPYCQAYTLVRKGAFVGMRCDRMALLKQSLRGPLDRAGITIPVPLGAPVQSVASGRVVYAGWQRIYGQTVILDHGQRFYSIYAHLSRIQVKHGQDIPTHELIGASGSTGAINRPSLYFELRHISRVLPVSRWLRQIAAPRR